MKRVLAAAVGVVLLAQLLFGSSADLGPTRLPAATALLLFACGAGLVLRGGSCAKSRARDALVLVLFVLLRGPLCDAICALLPGGARDAWLTAAAVSLMPPGLLLGRLLRGATDGAFALLLAGTALGAVACSVGAAGWAPAWIGVPVAVGLAWRLARRPEACELRAAEATTPPEAAIAAPSSGLDAAPQSLSPALLLGAAIALVAICFRRVVPSYAPPSAQPATDVLLALLLPAALVAWPAGVLARGRAARWLGALGGLALCATAWVTVDSLGLYENSVALVGLKRQFHDRALQSGGLLLDWHVWLLSFAGVVAAALGVAAGAVRGARAAGAALLGAGLAQLAEVLLIDPGSPAATDPIRAPLRLLLAASACGVLLVPLFLFGRKGWLALPLALLPFLDWPPHEGVAWFSAGQLRELAGFDEVRRPGEYGAEAFERTLLADVTVFSTPGQDSRALEGRDAYTQTLSPRSPMFSLGPAGELQSVLLPPPAPAPALPDTDAPDSAAAAPPADVQIERFFGVRVAGQALHRQHAPIGPEGSVSRLTRLFAQPGRVLACGIGAELVAADLHDAELATSAVVASPVPLGHGPLRVLLDHLASGGWQAGEVGDPQVALRSLTPSSIDTLVVAPGPQSLPGTAETCTVESVERMRRLLAPGGRCLLWLDTEELGARELRARLAAFGAAFGVSCAAFVEPRELDAPFVLLLGWKGDAGRPAEAALQAHLPAPDVTGFRARLRGVGDLASLLLQDGRGMQAFASEGPVHARTRPVTGLARASAGWAAVAAVAAESPELAQVIAGASPGRPGSRATLAGLALHGRYVYALLGLNDTLLEIKPDVNWSAFDDEVACYVRAAAQEPQDPLLQLALAALLEPLVVVGDLTRFGRVYETCHAEQMHSWRLALQEAWVRQQGLQELESAAALERARRWASDG